MKTKPKRTTKRKQTTRQVRKGVVNEMTLRIDDLTVGDAKQLAQLFGNGAARTMSETAYQAGTKYFVRSVTHYYTGLCKRVTDGELVLVQAAWIADTGRFHEFLKSGAGKANEIEPYPDECEVIVPRGGIIDASTWPHDLPRVAK